jgi:hypothetical protein
MYPSNPGFGRGLSFWDMKNVSVDGAVQSLGAGQDGCRCDD